MNCTVFKILPTFACNARCLYCYESGLNPVTIDEPTARQTAQFIAQNANGKHVNITWYGGEPLVAANKITFICQELLRLNVDFTSTIISNMSLFDSKIVEDSISIWKLKYLMVTLDAVHEKYNKIKNFKSDKYNYNVVIDNIDRAIKNGIKVDIRVNFDCNDLSNAIDVIDFAKDYFGNKVILHVKPLITEYSSVFNDFNGEHPYSKILDKQIDAGFPVTAHRLGLTESKTGCPHINTARFAVIDPLGQIFNCEKFMTNRHSIGTVWNCPDPFKNDCSVVFPYTECSDCKLKRYCKGGCESSVLKDKRVCPQTQPIINKIKQLFPEVF